MIYPRRTHQLTLKGWPAVSAMITLLLTKALTILVLSLPITWLVNHIFAAGAIHAVFGADHYNYWRSVGLFAIWHATRGRITFSGPTHSMQKEF